MGSNRRRRPRRPRDEANKAKPTPVSRSDEEPPPAGAATPAVHDVPDHVLELIFLRLDSSISLVRAASACKLWFRVVADAGFQARFHLRVPLVLGHYHNFVHDPEQDHPRPAFVPSVPSSPGRNRSTTSIRQSVSLDFVPEFRSGSWEAIDSRDGLLLLRNNKWRNSSTSDPDLVVCEPKTRRYRLIAMPGGSLSSSRAHHLGQFLLRGGATGIRHGAELSASMSNFKVLVVVLRGHILDSRRGVPGARVYSGIKYSWREVPCAWTGNIDVPRTATSFYFAGRANGCLYWGVKGSSRADALVLNEATAGVSMEALPACMEGWAEERCFRVVGGEDGTLRALRLTENNLRVFCRRLDAAGGEWELEKLVRLPKDNLGLLASAAMIVAVHEMYALVTPRHSEWLFSVDLRTMVVERVGGTNIYFERYPYELPWPPTLKP